MEYPMSGHVVETPRVKPCKRPYFSRFAKNPEYRWWTLHFLLLIFTKIPRYALCYPNVYSKSSRNVKILLCRMRWNSMILEISSVFTCLKFHGTWNTRDSKSLEFHELLMLKLWQNFMIRGNCSTPILSISMHDIEKFLLQWYLTICFLVSIALHCILLAYLWGCSIIKVICDVIAGAWGKKF